MVISGDFVQASPGKVSAEIKRSSLLFRQPGHDLQIGHLLYWDQNVGAFS